MKTSSKRFHSKRLTFEYESKGWKFKVVGVPGMVDVNSGEEIIPGKTGIQLMNVLKQLSHTVTKIKNLPTAEVKIKFSKVA